MNSSSSPNASYLELQSENGDKKWQKVGVISNSKSEGDGKNEHIAKPNEEKDHRTQLPLNIKNILSPNAKIKSDRRANYMYRHSSDKIDTNLLILLHGAGDSHLPFHALAKKMNIPQTATLSINANAMNRGFVTIPFDLGYTWFEEMEYTTGQTYDPSHPKRLATLNNASEKIDGLIDRIIEETDNWMPERIFLFGYSAGASTAMNLCQKRAMFGKPALGGVVCVAGGFKGVEPNEDKVKELIGRNPQYTPLLLMGGSKDVKYPVSMLKRDVQLYGNGQVVKAFIQEGKGHEMVHRKEEVKYMMEFFGEKTVRRTLAMEGWSEVSSFAS